MTPIVPGTRRCVTAPVTPAIPDWTPPSDWLTLSTMAEGDPTRIEILVEVLPNNEWHNMVNFNFTGTLTVDWGDGTSESVTNGKVYTYNFANANLTTLDNGNKMAKIVATGTCTSWSPKVKLAGFTAQVNNKNSHRVKQIKASLPNATTISNSFSDGASNVGMPYVERMDFYTGSTLTTISYLAGFCKMLKTLTISNVSAVTAAVSVYNGNPNMIRTQAMNIPLCTNVTSMYSDSNIGEIGALTVGNSCNMTNALYKTVCPVAPVVVFGTGCNITGLFSSAVFGDTDNLQDIDMSTATAIIGIFTAVNINTLDFIPPSTPLAFGQFPVNLVTIGAIDATNLTWFSTMPGTLLVDCDMYTIKDTISFANQQLSATVIDKIFGNLSTVTGKTITVTNNPGAETCTTSIATAKGWTVVI